MSTDSRASSSTSQSTCEVDGRFPFFYLSEGADLRIPDADGWAGLISVGDGKLKLLIPISMGKCAVAVETHRASPPDQVDDYEDVIECSYRSPTGSLVVLDWSKASAGVLVSLTSGPGDYRVRYHVREPLAASRREGGSALIQFWPAPLDEPRYHKISGKLGAFWHPAPALRRSLEF